MESVPQFVVRFVWVVEGVGGWGFWMDDGLGGEVV